MVARADLDRFLRRRQRRLRLGRRSNRHQRRPGATVAIGIANGVVPATIANNPKGFIGGGQVGYNHQFGQWVLGVEADLQWSDIKRDQTDPHGGARPAFHRSAPG